MTTDNRVYEDVEVTARARAFTGLGVRTYRFMVHGESGQVRVWDEISGHFTYVHALSKAAERRIRKLAVQP